MPAIKRVQGTYQIQQSDFGTILIADDTNAVVALTLPPQGTPGEDIGLKIISPYSGSNGATLTTLDSAILGGVSISDGVLAINADSAADSLEIVSDGHDWWVLAGCGGKTFG